MGESRLPSSGVVSVVKVLPSVDPAVVGEVVEKSNDTTAGVLPARNNFSSS